MDFGLAERLGGVVPEPLGSIQMLRLRGLKNRFLSATYFVPKERTSLCISFSTFVGLRWKENTFGNGAETSRKDSINEFVNLLGGAVILDGAHNNRWAMKDVWRPPTPDDLDKILRKISMVTQSGRSQDKKKFQ